MIRLREILPIKSALGLCIANNGDMKDKATGILESY